MASDPQLRTSPRRRGIVAILPLTAAVVVVLIGAFPYRLRSGPLHGWIELGLALLGFAALALLWTIVLRAPDSRPRS